jgi:DNA-binding IclR family transcriptional regulator
MCSHVIALQLALHKDKEARMNIILEVLRSKKLAVTRATLAEETGIPASECKKLLSILRKRGVVMRYRSYVRSSLTHESQGVLAKQTSMQKHKTYKTYWGLA